MTETMPAAFVGHGNPMFAIESNRYTEAWRIFGLACPRPRAILVVSAHWYVAVTAVTAMARPRTIHDFFVSKGDSARDPSYPEELFAVEYSAPGSPDVAEEVTEIVKPTWIGMDLDSWGLDHGTWSVLCHAFPTADVPVLQLSIDATKPLEYHFDLGARLAPLRDRGVLIVGSGDVVHNLGVLDRRMGDSAFDWAQRFDDATHDLMVVSPAEIVGLVDHPDYRMAVPTPDHFVPLLYVAGLAAAAGRPTEAFAEGCASGSVSMTSYRLDGV